MNATGRKVLNFQKHHPARGSFRLGPRKSTRRCAGVGQCGLRGLQRRKGSPSREPGKPREKAWAQRRAARDPRLLGCAGAQARRARVTSPAGPFLLPGGWGLARRAGAGSRRGKRRSRPGCVYVRTREGRRRWSAWLPAARASPARPDARPQWRPQRSALGSARRAGPRRARPGRSGKQSKASSTPKFFSPQLRPLQRRRRPAARRVPCAPRSGGN